MTRRPTETTSTADLQQNWNKIVTFHSINPLMHDVEFYFPINLVYLFWSKSQRVAWRISIYSAITEILSLEKLSLKKDGMQHRVHVFTFVTQQTNVQHETIYGKISTSMHMPTISVWRRSVAFTAVIYKVTNVTISLIVSMFEHAVISCENVQNNGRAKPRRIYYISSGLTFHNT